MPRLRSLLVCKNNVWRYMFHKLIVHRLKFFVCVMIVALLAVTWMRHVSSYSTHIAVNIAKIKEKISKHNIDISVIEEHHEAVMYWYSSVFSGKTAATGNTLLHIDAHSDTGVPAYHPGMFSNERVVSALDVHSLMLRNDAFILSSAYKELITRIIWVYPDWLDQTQLSPKSRKSKPVSVFIGHTTLSLPYNSETLFANCACEEIDEDDMQCTFVDPYGYEISDVEADCDFVKTLEMYHIRANDSSRLLPSILQADEPIILDIDEDFYGVMKGSDFLAGIDYQYVVSLDNWLQTQVRVHNVQEEAEAHIMLKELFSLVSSACPKLTEKRQRSCGETEILQIYGNLTSKHLVDYLAVKNLVKYASEMFTDQQLKQINDVGYCMVISPFTYKLPGGHRELGYDSMAVCHGRNHPETLNQIRLPPDLADINHSSNSIQVVLDLIEEQSVQIVTLCRSNRDGYTPRNLVTTIEREIIALLKRKFKSTNIIYDTSLMTHL